MKIEKIKVARGDWLEISGADTASLAPVWVNVGTRRIAAYSEGDKYLVKVPDDMEPGSVVVSIAGERLGVVAIQ